MPITLKLPPTTVRLLRAYARSSGLTIGEIVTRALEAFLDALAKAWLSGVHRRGSLQVHLDYAFDRLRESKLAQAYDILVPARERLVGARVRESVS